MLFISKNLFLNRGIFLASKSLALWLLRLWICDSYSQPKTKKSPIPRPKYLSRVVHIDAECGLKHEKMCNLAQMPKINIFWNFFKRNNSEEALPSEVKNFKKHFDFNLCPCLPIFCYWTIFILILEHIVRTVRLKCHMSMVLF